jgi:hypothetical protein
MHLVDGRPRSETVGATITGLKRAARQKGIIRTLRMILLQELVDETYIEWKVYDDEKFTNYVQTMCEEERRALYVAENYYWMKKHITG